jgi:hypothetical protein
VWAFEHNGRIEQGLLFVKGEVFARVKAAFYCAVYQLARKPLWFLLQIEG